MAVGSQFQRPRHTVLIRSRVSVRAEPNRASKRSVPALGYVLLGFESGKKDLLDWEWKDNSFLTDSEENFLRSLLVPRAPTSVPARVEGRGPIPIGVSTHLLSCAVMF